MPRQYVVISHMDTSQCVQKIVSQSRTQYLLNTNVDWRAGNLVAQVEGNRFSLWISSNHGVQNAFRPIMRGDIENSDNFSIIKYRFLLSPFVYMLIGFWYAIIVIIECSLVLCAIMQWGTGTQYFLVNPLLAFFIPILFALCGYGFVYFARWLGRSDEKILLALVSQILDAKAIEGQSKSAS